MFIAGALDFLVGDKCSGALLGFEDAANLHLAVGALDGVGVDGEVDGDLAHGGQLLAGLERAGGDSGLHLVDELAIYGHAAVRVEGKGEGFGRDLE